MPAQRKRLTKDQLRRKQLLALKLCTNDDGNKAYSRGQCQSCGRERVNDIENGVVTEAELIADYRITPRKPVGRPRRLTKSR